MKAKLIGINPYDIKRKGRAWNATKEAYFEAVWRAGGCPVTLSHTQNNSQIIQAVSCIDSLLMVGGPDIPSEKYNSKNPHLLDPDTMSEQREAFDRAIFLEAMKQNKKILAICAGVQHANVIYGGTLIEDIPTLVIKHIDHGVFNGEASIHSVEIIDQESLISNILKQKTIKVKSSHHQSINKLGKDIYITAKSSDGIVEAVEIKGKNNFIGVQWHPEIMPKSKQMDKLFIWLTS